MQRGLPTANLTGCGLVPYTPYLRLGLLCFVLRVSSPVAINFAPSFHPFFARSNAPSKPTPKSQPILAGSAEPLSRQTLLVSLMYLAASGSDEQCKRMKRLPSAPLSRVVV